MSAARSLTLLSALLLAALVFPDVAAAQDRGERPWRADVSLTGNVFSGNLRQVQTLGRVHVSRSGARAGGDLVATGFRVWMQPGEDAPWVRVGDDLSATFVPFVYVRPGRGAGGVYVQGFAGYADSLSRQLDARVNVGGAVGFAPVRTENVLVRAAIGAQVEHARYPTDTFNVDVGQEGASRTVPRAVLSSNGWYRVKGTPVSMRYLGHAMLDPGAPRDNRQFLDAGFDVRVAEGWSTRLSVLYTRDSVVPTGIRPADLRAGIGVAYSTPKGGGS